MERGVELAKTVDSFSSAVRSLRVFRQDAQIPKNLPNQSKEAKRKNEEKSVE